jgi:quercetin dioxygenase-like cupin family protein
VTVNGCSNEEKPNEMIHTGHVIHNPVTGETLRFVKTSRDTNGEAVVVEVAVEPNGAVAAAHVHPFQTARFEIVSGRLAFRRGREKLEAGPGDVVVVEPGTPHSSGTPATTLWYSSPRYGPRCSSSS